MNEIEKAKIRKEATESFADFIRFTMVRFVVKGVIKMEDMEKEIETYLAEQEKE